MSTTSVSNSTGPNNQQGGSGILQSATCHYSWRCTSSPLPSESPSSNISDTSTSLGTGTGNSTSTQTGTTWPASSGFQSLTTPLPSSQTVRSAPSTTGLVSLPMATAVSTPFSSPTAIIISPSAAAHAKTPVGAIVGGIVGGVAGLTIVIALLIFFRRRHRKSHIAPSAEFMGKAHSGTPPTHEEFALPLARQTSLEDVDAPPPFTPGSYSDPVFEKVRAAEQMREEYRIRDDFDGRSEKTALIA